MAQKTREELNTANAALFVNNSTGDITPELEQAFNADWIDSTSTLSDDNDFTGVNNHIKEVRWHKGVNLASATAIALGLTGNYHHITGNTEIETLSTKQHGTRMLFYFVSNPNLKNSSNLLLGGQDIQTFAGSSAEFVSEGGGVWRLIQYFSATSPREFRVELTQSELFNGVTKDIPELPAPGAGFAWSLYNAELKYNYGTEPYDATDVRIKANGTTRPQFIDNDTIQAVESFFMAMAIKNTTDGDQITIIENAKMQIQVVSTSTTGDGTAVVYGIARLITV